MNKVIFNLHYFYRTGLIPSREYQDRRISQSGTSEESLSSSQSKSDSSKKKDARSMSFRRKKKAKKMMFSSAKSLEKDAEVMHCYEEVHVFVLCSTAVQCTTSYSVYNCIF